jgi:hypothetical protein
MDGNRPVFSDLNDLSEQRFYKILLKTIVDNMDGCPGDELLKLV